MPSEKLPSQRATTTWILLTQDQMLILVSKTDELIEALGKQEFEGKAYYMNIIKSVRDYTEAKKRISIKQLKAIQKGWNKTLGEPLYVPGLESYLFENEELIQRGINRRKKQKLDEEFYD